MTSQQWQTARQSRDPRFDGVFFVAVKSTGIYCRPICAAPTAQEKNVVGDAPWHALRELDMVSSNLVR